MRKFLFAFFALGMLNAGAQGFIDLQVKLAKQRYEQEVQNVSRARIPGTVLDEKSRMELFVTCSEDANTREVAAAMKEIDGQVRVVKGRLIALDIPYSQLDALANIEGVEIINMPPKVVQKSDVSRRVTQAVEVNDGTAPQLPQAYTGKGVIVGVIDGGFDVSHPMFKDKDGNLRIKGFYQPGNSSFGGEPAVVPLDDGSSYTLSGSAYSNPEDLLDTLKVKDISGSHGSYCASIAASSIMNDVKGTSGQPLGGIAPESDILLCNIRNSESGNPAMDVLESIYYLGGEALKTEKPIVISLSLNSHDGWHDGTSDMARYIGLMSKEGEMAIMLCSSNEGGNQIYVNERVNAKDTLRLIPHSNKTDNYVWGGLKTDKNVKMQVGIINLDEKKEYYRIPVTFNSNGTGLYGPGLWFNFDDDSQELMAKLTTAKKEFAKYMKGGQLSIYCYQTRALNQEGEVYIYSQVYVGAIGTEWLDGASENGNGSKWGFNIYLIPEEDTELHAWGDMGLDLIAVRPDGTMVPGTGECSVGDWNTSGNPVSVGAWAANNTTQYEDKPAEESGYLIGDVAFFSSYGTDLAGHKHPDVCAPGTDIVGALNSFDPSLKQLSIFKHQGYENQFAGQSQSHDYFWGTGSGTSSSTPVVAGVVALWMQAAKDKGKKLTCDDIKDIIAHSCDTDEFTEASPERFGHGKINAYKGLLYVLGIDSSIPNLSKEQPGGVTFRVVGDLVYADGAEDGTPAIIYNLQGANVRETLLQGGALSLAGLPRGVYALQLGKQGSTLIRKVD